MVFLPTSTLAYQITLACLLFFLVRPFVSLAAPKASLPLGLAALSRVLTIALILTNIYGPPEAGPGGMQYGYLAANLLLWVGLGLAVAAVIEAAKVDIGAVFQRFPLPAVLIAGGLGAGLLHIVIFFVPMLPFPGVVLVTAGVVSVVAGLLVLMDQAWPLRGQLPPVLQRNRNAEPGRLFFPGFIGFFVTGYLLLAILSEPRGYSPVHRVAELASMDVLLVGWAVMIKRHLPFFWVLERRHEAVVWIFIRETRVIRGAARWTVWAANIGTDSGQIMTQSMASERDAGEACSLIGQACPFATQGYNEQARAAFAKSPASLRQGPPPG